MSLYREFVGKNVVIVSQLPIVMCGETRDGTVPVQQGDGGAIAMQMYACKLEDEDGDTLLFSTVHPFVADTKTRQRFVVKASQVQVHLAEKSALVLVS